MFENTENIGSKYTKKNGNKSNIFDIIILK